MKANPSCNLQIDYSGMTGERRLPFVISLNLEDSILTPSENEHQKFCYDIVGVGNDQPQDADLSHLWNLSFYQRGRYRGSQRID